MSSEDIRPSTLPGIKRYAKSLKAKYGMSHHEALGVAAQAAGFQNFNHARNKLSSPKQPSITTNQNVHIVRISAYWEDPKTGSQWCESLSCSLTKPLKDIITPSLGNPFKLGGFGINVPDHLEHTDKFEFASASDNQDAARRHVCRAYNCLVFMDATNLCLSKNHNSYWQFFIPGCDHFSVWYDPKTKRDLIVDEPYESSIIRIQEERNARIEQLGYEMIKPSWAGMYEPGLGSRMYLISPKKNGVPLASIVDVLQNLPPPVSAQAWEGESVLMLPTS